MSQDVPSIHLGQSLYCERSFRPSGHICGTTVPCAGTKAQNRDWLPVPGRHGGSFGIGYHAKKNDIDL